MTYPDSWKLLCRGPPIRYQKHVPFQTKIQRHYPQATHVPYAGKTTQEVALAKSPLKTTLRDSGRVPCAKSHFESGSIGAVVCTSPKYQQKRLTLTRNQDSNPITTEINDQPLRTRRLMAFERREANSEQAQILIQSQYPPYGGGQYKRKGVPPTCAIAGISSVPEELIAPPEKTGGKRISPVEIRSRPELLFHSFDEPSEYVGAKGRMKKHDQKGLNVFNYPLPTNRSRFYIGCVAKPAVKTAALKANQDSLIVSVKCS